MSEKNTLTPSLIVLVTAILALFGAMYGSGVFGGMSMTETAGGVLAPDATLVAPDTPAFSIWTVIYLGLVALAVWNLNPRIRDSALFQEIWPWVTASLILNVGWIFTVRFELLWLSVLVIFLLLAVLCVIAIALVPNSSLPTAAQLAWRAVFGLYVGWVAVASIPNVASALVFYGVEDIPPGGTFWAILLIIIAVIIAVALTFRLPGLVTAPLAIAWGLTWVSVARLGDQNPNVIVGWVAAFSAVAIVCTAVVWMATHRRSVRA
ncbi:hypothetical protein [Jonesia quinghaiensis]|uniref:hypothetical protein n=1 Tax=Jonesia quinghaiensis TaxID=262806 RepID=UPI000412478C|nr:hypothetical protein [Jonesia quinghaiensis]